MSSTQELTRTAPERGVGPGLWTLMNAELLKLRTTRIWWWLLLVALLLTALYAVLIAAVAGVAYGGVPSGFPPPSDPSILRAVYGSALNSAYVMPLIVGVLGMGAEYRHKTITPSLLAVPRRGRLVASKVLAYLMVGLGMGVAMSIVAVALGALTIVIRGYPIGLGADGVWRTLALSVLGCGIWAVFGLGIGTLISNQVVAITVTLATQLLIEPLLTLVLSVVPHGGSVAQFFPSATTTAMVAGSTAGLNTQALSWWAGALVLTAYGLVFAGLGGLVTTRRDVT